MISDLRKKQLINNEVQVGIIKQLVYYGVSLSIIFLLSLYYISNNFIIKIGSVEQIDQNLQVQLYKDLNMGILIFFILTVVATLVTSFISSYYSNKIVGPIYNINKTILNYLNGSNSERVKIRKNDHFKDLADNVNKLIEQIEQKK